MSVKEPKFIVLGKEDGYEIREYVPTIEARVMVEGKYKEAMTAGFRILAGYIFGGNTRKQSIAMTAPVSEQGSESIAMTAPVSNTQLTKSSYVVSFVMPEEYTLATLPAPDDSHIELLEVPARTSAALVYSGYATASKVEKMKAKLLQCLERDNVAIMGVPRSARYNPPWTLPFMMRNEILVDIKK